MDEGVDPKNLCQQIVTSIDEHAELKSLADPQIRSLFIDWMEELEQEILDQFHLRRPPVPDDLINRFPISRQGAEFLLRKMKQEGKL